MINVGDKVKTNMEYFETYNRTVFGEVIEVHRGYCCVVKVTRQTGKKPIKAYTGNLVIMLERDLEPIKLNVV